MKNLEICHSWEINTFFVENCSKEDTSEIRHTKKEAVEQKPYWETARKLLDISVRQLQLYTIFSASI